MIEITNNLAAKNFTIVTISYFRGINNFLDGYYFIKRSTLPAIYGMANSLLRNALISKENFGFIKAEIGGINLLQCFYQLNN